MSIKPLQLNFLNREERLALQKKETTDEWKRPALYTAIAVAAVGTALLALHFGVPSGGTAQGYGGYEGYTGGYEGNPTGSRTPSPYSGAASNFVPTSTPAPTPKFRLSLNRPEAPISFPSRPASPAPSPKQSVPIPTPTNRTPSPNPKPTPALQCLPSFNRTETPISFPGRPTSPAPSNIELIQQNAGNFPLNLPLLKWVHSFVFPSENPLVSLNLCSLENHPQNLDLFSEPVSQSDPNPIGLYQTPQSPTEKTGNIVYVDSSDPQKLTFFTSSSDAIFVLEKEIMELVCPLNQPYQEETALALPGTQMNGIQIHRAADRLTLTFSSESEKSRFVAHLKQAQNSSPSSPPPVNYPGTNEEMGINFIPFKPSPSPTPADLTALQWKPANVSHWRDVETHTHKNCSMGKPAF